MLEFIRNHRTLFSVFFVLAGTAMVMSMFADPSAMQSGGGLSSGVAAKVDGEEISIQNVYSATIRRREQLQENIEEQVAKSENKAETRKFLDQLLKSQVSPDRVLAEIISEKFQMRASERVGIDVPPDAIVNILQNTPYFHKDGKFDPVLYKNSVSQPGLYEAELRQRAKQYALNRAFISSMSLLSPEEQKNEAWLNKPIQLETLVIDPSKFNESIKSSTAEIAAFAEDPAQQSKIQAYFDRNARKYKSDEEVKARHILFKVDGKKDSEAEKLATQVLADIKSNKITFEAAAQQYSADKSNSERGGDLGFFGKGMMDPAFEKAAFALKANGELVSKPIKSSFGYHLIQRDDLKAASSKALSDVKLEIAETLLNEQKRMEKLRNWAQGVIENPSRYEVEIKKLGFKWTPTQWTPLESTLGSIGNIDEHRASILTLKAGNSFLKEPIKQGENLVLVRLASASKATEKQEGTDLSTSRLAQDKAVEALKFFLQNERERLEKAKRIVRDEKAIAQLKQAMGDNEALPIGR